MLDVSPRPLDHFHLRSKENKINRKSSFKFPIPPVRKVFFQVLKLVSSRLQFTCSNQEHLRKSVAQIGRSDTAFTARLRLSA